MDPRFRRRNAGLAEQDEESGDHQYRTALGQMELSAGSSREASSAALNGNVAPGEASPGMLESGEAGGPPLGEPLPVANPFHSERVKTEVKLLRSRPASLDQDAARLGVGVDAQDLGEAMSDIRGEPDYSSAFGPTEARIPPRVARVEASSVGPTEIGLAHGGTDSSPPVAEDKAGLTGPDLAAAGDDPVKGDEEGGKGTLGPDPFTEAGDDQRELIPDESDRFGRFELLLTQALEENRQLKRRLEQAESRSHSSYHSGLAQQDPSFSPATFGPRVNADVQRFLATEFPGRACMNLGGKGSGIWSMGTEGVLAGGTHSWAGPRAEVISMGGDAREMMMGNQVIAPSRATEAYGRAPPPPLPLPLPPVPSFPTREPNFEPSMPPSQTMRQFTEQVMGDQG